MADKLPLNEKKLTEEEALHLTAERDRPATSRETHQVEEDLHVEKDQELQNESGWVSCQETCRLCIFRILWSTANSWFIAACCH